MMPVDNQQQTGATRRTTFLLVILLATAVRVWVGWNADPLDLDVGHFVRFGKALADGNPSGFSHHWSLGPILLTALTYRLGLDPLFWLQVSTLLAGVIATGACMVMVHRLCGIRPVALLAGLLMACNPSMIVYSVNSMGEMPFIALLLLAAVVQIPPEGVTRHHPGRFLSAAALLGLGYLYRPVESYMAFGLLGLWQVKHTWTSRAFSRLLWIGLAAVVFISFSMPQTVVTKIRTGVWSPSTKFAMLVYRDYGTDSKAMYGLNTPLQEEQRRYEEMGTARYLWAQKAAIARSSVRTAGNAFRELKGQLFDGSFRIGTGWAIGLAMAGAIVLWNARWRKLLLACASFPAAISAVLCLSYVHTRFMVTSIPFTASLFSALAYAAYSRLQDRRLRGALLVLLALAMGSNILYAKVNGGDGWYAQNIIKVARQMKRYAGEDDVIMSLGPPYAVRFYERHAWPLWDNMPYGTIEEVLDYAASRSVKLIVVAHRTYPHWPIQKLFDGAPLPPGWTIAAHPRFERYNPRWGDETDEYLLLLREEPGGAEPSR
jgi:hypothetical protein